MYRQMCAWCANRKDDCIESKSEAHAEHIFSFYELKMAFFVVVIFSFLSFFCAVHFIFLMEVISREQYKYI